MADQNEQLIELMSHIINDSLNQQVTMRQTHYPAYEDYYNGDQLPTASNDARSEQKAYNICRSKVDAIAAICTDKRPKIEMIPRDGQDPAQAALASLAMDWISDEARFFNRIDLAHQESVKMNLAWEEALWIKGANGIGGRPWGLLHSPRYTFWDSGAFTPEEMRWVGLWRWRPKGDIKREYPEFNTEEMAQHFGIDDATISGPEPGDVMGKVLEVRAYLRPSAYLYRKGWEIPNGMTRVVIAGKQVLEHKGIGAATRDFAMTPFRFRPQANQIEGVSLLHDLMEIQDDINNLIWIMKKTCEKGGIPWGEIRRALYDKLGDKLTNEFLQWVPVDRLGEIQIHEGIGFPQEMLLLFRELLNMADRVTLFRDVSEAMGRGTRMSGTSIRAAQEVNLSALRRTIREYENSVKMLGMTHFHNFIDNGGFANVRVKTDESKEILRQVGDRRGAAQMENVGAFTIVPISARDLTGSWDMKVVVTPAPPMGQASYREQVMAELQVGVRDKVSAMQALGISDWREILQRQKEEEERQMMMMMATQGGGAASQGGGQRAR